MEHPRLLTYEDGAVFTPSFFCDPISLSRDAFWCEGLPWNSPESIVVVLFGSWILKKCHNPEPDVQFDSPFFVILRLHLRIFPRKNMRSLRCQPGFLTRSIHLRLAITWGNPRWGAMEQLYIGGILIDGGVSWIPSMDA